MPTVLAGTTLSVSATLPETNDQAGFEVLTFTKIRGVRIMGDIGKQYNTQSYQSFGMPAPINKRYGVRPQSMNLEVFRITDAGQTILKAAIDADSHAYRIVEPDGSTTYFTATASSRLSGRGDQKSIADVKMVLELDAPPIEI